MAYSMRRRSSVAVIACLACSIAAGAFAGDDLLSQSPSSTAKAGPTRAAAQQFCGEPADRAEILIARYAQAPNLKKVYESPDYIAYADDEKSPTVMYTLTTNKHPAYPAAVCRKTVKDGDNLVMKMEIVCDGKEEACGTLSKDFTAMNAVMQSQVDSKIKDAGDK